MNGVTAEQVAGILWDSNHVLKLSTSLSEVKTLKKIDDSNEIVVHPHKSPCKYNCILIMD